jgi:hypothetical protein
MQRYASNIWLLSRHDYRVVNIILIINIIIWNWITTFEHKDQAITYFRECRGDLNQFTTLQGKDLTTRHMRATKTHEWPQFMMTIKESSWFHLTLAHVFHVIPRRASVGGSYTIPYTPSRYGRVSPNSTTTKATKFVWPNKSHVCQYIIDACSSGLSWRGP